MPSHNKLKSRAAANVVSNIQIATNIYEMVLHHDDVSRATQPGQFINLYCNGKATLLPRPISICETQSDYGTMKIVYAVVGAGTEEFSQRQPGDTVDILGPLGHGYDMHEGVKEHIIVGGGLGIPPLLELTKRLIGKKKVVLGFRDETFLVDAFKHYADELYVATNDGSVGEQGTVIDILERHHIRGDMLYSCGPKAMLEEVQPWCIQHEIEGQISMEERMGCGFGACVGCVTKVKNQETEQWEYKKICSDGPIFYAKEVVFDV
ncbi:dihydroorotate dehydrogenase electron transfer subunit [Longirhabdus pacifica]|uniref:dihydroorotate dehydrogenase electron transfer subunit n=1 Tax=Longirhabdus pacifica TaxID=2305227 RepID=UPI001008B028|nr:dihydroorotate dehydrogenase electron transfer subunit [Longirhabdus pacifica]